MRRPKILDLPLEKRQQIAERHGKSLEDWEQSVKESHAAMQDYIARVNANELLTEKDVSPEYARRMSQPY